MSDILQNHRQKTISLIISLLSSSSALSQASKEKIFEVATSTEKKIFTSVRNLSEYDAKVHEKLSRIAEKTKSAVPTTHPNTLSASSTPLQEPSFSTSTPSLSKAVSSPHASAEHILEAIVHFRRLVCRLITPPYQQLNQLSFLMVKLRHPQSTASEVQDVIHQLKALVPWIIEVEQSSPAPSAAVDTAVSWIPQCRETPLSLPALTSDNCSAIQQALSHHFNGQISFLLYRNQYTITDIYCFIHSCHHLMRIIIGENSLPLMIEATLDKSWNSNKSTCSLQHTHPSLLPIQRHVNECISQQRNIGVVDVIIEYCGYMHRGNKLEASLRWDPLSSMLTFCD